MNDIVEAYLRECIGKLAMESAIRVTDEFEDGIIELISGIIDGIIERTEEIVMGNSDSACTATSSLRGGLARERLGL